jgi:hypothetical protein
MAVKNQDGVGYRLFEKNICHFVKFRNPKLAFLDKMTYYQQIRIKKNFSKSR